MNNNKYRLLVLDIDGTLLGASRTVSRQNREAVEKAAQAGITVTISTGRSLKSSLNVLNQLCLDSYHIFFDGGLVGTPDLGEEVYSQPINPDLARQMVEFAHDNGINLELFSPRAYYAERETWSTEAHYKYFGVDAVVGSFDGIWERERIIKCGLVTNNREQEELSELFRRHFDRQVHFSAARTPAYPGVVFNNILADGVSKGKAVKALAAHRGIPVESVAAVGDGTNDISLLESAGLGIAMGNAPDELKAIADHVTLDVEQHGLAEAIYRFIL